MPTPEETIPVTGVKADVAEKKEEKAKERTDERYKDEGAYLVIISSDNVRFRVEKCFVLAASMIKDCATTSPEVRLADDVLEKATIVRLFLDLACGIPFADFDSIPCFDILDLLKFCDKYDCPSPLQTIKLLTSRPVAKGKLHFHRFYYACAVDDLHTAHRILPTAASDEVWNAETAVGPAGRLDGQSCLDLTSTPISYLERLPRKYFYALLRSTHQRLTQPPGSWEDVADAFKEQVKIQETGKPAPA